MRDRHGRGAHHDMPPIIMPDEARRAFLKGLATLPLAAMLFDPILAHAQAESLETVRIPLGDGEPLRGVVALPEADAAPAVLVIHEWWGLNDEIKAKAAEFAKLGFVALAIDLYDAEPATRPEEAMKLVQGLDPAMATAKLVAAIGWLQSHEKANGRVGTVGWAFGGSWSLNASLATPVDATVVYYGNVDKTAAELKALHGPVLGHFGTLDQNITRDMVEAFEKAMTDAGKAEMLKIHWYEADQGFASPTSTHYDADDARLARDRTVEFLKTRLTV